MDEPTAPLSERETGLLLEVVARLRAAGVAVVYITHRLKEIYQGPGRVTVLRDGVRVASAPVSEMPRELLIRHMVGRDVEEQFPARPPRPASAETALRIVNFTRAGEFQGVNLELRRGEIVGLAGLVGAGRTEVLEAIFGASRPDAGAVYMDGARVAINSPRDAIRRGIALVPDDRNGKGLIPGASVRWNMAIAARREFRIRRAGEARDAERLVSELRIRAAHVERPVTQLSGGNQQKVVLAKWLLTGSRIFLFDEPARGVDVGVKAEIYALIRGLAESGAAVLFASSDLDEVLRLADRVLVMHRGRVAGELAGEAATAESVMRLATGAH
jgi:ribose transport system ATP-binding protein